MGYRAEVRGQVVLNGTPEADVVAALRRHLLEHDGWLYEEEPVATFADLGPFVCADLACDGDVVSFTPFDASVDSKWSFQTSAFYVELGRWVRAGDLRAEGEDGVSWRYRYEPDRVTQEGRNVWGGVAPGTTTFATP